MPAPKLQKTAFLLSVGLLMHLSASATLYVDYVTPGSGSARTEDSDTLFGDTWNFSDTTALIPAGTGGQSDLVYGGLITTWDTSSNYSPVFQHQSNGLQLQIGDQGGTQTAQGVYIWQQADFLNGGDSGTVSLGASSSLTMNIALAGTSEYRALVNQAGTYYVSETNFTSGGSDVVFDLTTDNWAELNTNDYTYGGFASLTLDDVQSVGVWFDQSRVGLTRFRVEKMQLAAFDDNAPIILANIFGSGCVLQREETVAIWGTGAPGDTITVQVKSQSVQAVVDGSGQWLAELAPEPAGGPFTLTVSSPGKASVVLTDVYFGDVWILTGQSNMFNQLQGLQEGREPYPYYPQPVYRDDPSNDFDDVRFFIVSNVESAGPVDDIEVEDPWTRWQSNSLGHMSVVGYYFTRALNEFFDANGMSDVPIGIIKACRGATGAEEWTSPAGLATMSESIILAGPNSTTSGYYNGVLQPIQNYAIKGALWYQGENNSGSYERCEQYDLVMQALIESWRDEWGIDFPFYFVQLAPYQEFTPIPSDERWPWLRESQTKTLDLVANTAMACIIDIGFQSNIHPAYKDIVGQRLANIALADTYGFDLVTRGPTVSDVAINGSSVTITFDNVADGLRTQAVDAQDNSEEIGNNDLPVSVSENVLAGFALCGSDQKFYWATHAEIISENQVRISNPVDVPNPVNVRYAWQFFPMCNLFNSAGLPAEPFRTDDYAPETSTGGEVTSPNVTLSITGEEFMLEWQPVSTDWVLQSKGDLTDLLWVDDTDTLGYTSESGTLGEAQFFRLNQQTP